jgi:hypothetical protein
MAGLGYHVLTTNTGKGSAVNRWQRTWVVTCGVLALVTVGLGMYSIPSRSDLEQWHRVNTEAHEAHLRNMQKFGYHAFTNDDMTVQQVQSKLRQHNDDYAQRVQNLPSTRVQISIFLFVSWLGTCLLLYGAGLTVRWIRRGTTA